MKNISPSKLAEIAIHIFAWLFIFTSPLFFNHGQGGIDIPAYLRGSVFPMLLMVVFYANYFCLAPKFFMRGDKKKFFIFEVVIILVATILMQEVLTLFPHEANHAKTENFYIPPRWVFIARDIATMALAAGFGFTIRLSYQWHKAETARKEAELGRREAELKNLRNQINPHFLLNTLNNIYALTAFDAGRAQSTIQELSRLLRCILYENQDDYTTLAKETDFLKSYINLMRIRIPRTVDLQVDIDQAADSSVQIAPLIFISLVENAFKHGISATEPSFIHLSLKVNNNNGHVEFYSENSNYPKSHNDLSGNGVGLRGVESRLQLLYPGKYHWEKGTNDDATIYSSHLKIQTQ